MDELVLDASCGGEGEVWVTAVNLDVVISQLLVKMKLNLIQRWHLQPSAALIAQFLWTRLYVEGVLFRADHRGH